MEPDGIDWSLTTWEGNRRRQHQEFLALSFREKLERLERMGEVTAFFSELRRARGLPVREASPPYAPDAGREPGGPSKPPDPAA